MKSTIGLLLAIITALAHAQVSQPPTSARTETITVIALDKKGNPVQDLQPGDISVEYDDRPVRVLKVDTAAATPLVYAVAVDFSGSGKDKEKYTREYALQLIKFLSEGKNRGGLILFNDQIMSASEVASLDDVRQQLERTHAKGGSAIYDALAAGAGAVKRIAQPGERRMVLAITDGEDNASHISRDKAVEVLNRAGVSFLCIGLVSSDPNLVSGAGVLEELAQKTRGYAALMKSPSDKWGTIIKNALYPASFLITFELPPPFDDNRHKLKVAITRKDAKRSWSQGYFIQ
jgi:VWFA-related protein